MILYAQLKWRNNKKEYFIIFRSLFRIFNTIEHTIRTMMKANSLFSSFFFWASFVFITCCANDFMYGTGLETYIPLEKRSGSERSLSGSSSSRSGNSEKSGSDASVYGSDGNMTPIHVTDSAPSDHGRTTAPGTDAYHKSMYKFYHRKGKYHQAIGDAYKAQNFDSQASQHYKESESSKKKKLKHRKYYRGVTNGNLKENLWTGPTDAVQKENFPNVPSKEEADMLIRDPAIQFKKHKGHFHLVAEPAQQKRRKKDQ